MGGGLSPTQLVLLELRVIRGWGEESVMKVRHGLLHSFRTCPH